MAHRPSRVAEWYMDPRDDGDGARTAGEPSVASPFARCPSAPPESSPTAHASVRVPSASSPAIVPERVDAARAASVPPIAAPTPTAPVERARDGRAPERPPPPVARRSLRHVAIAASLAAALGVTALGYRLAATKPAARDASPTTTEVAAAPTVAPPTVAPPSAAPEEAQPPPPAAAPSVIASSADAVPKKPFRRGAARAALDALAPELTDCRIPKGRSGNVELVFEPDGHVSSSKPLDVYVGTFGGKCVASHLKKARVPPFEGPPMTFAYAFVIPHER
jgi:hypothetical protein